MYSKSTLTQYFEALSSIWNYLRESQISNIIREFKHVDSPFSYPISYTLYPSTNTQIHSHSQECVRVCWVAKSQYESRLHTPS